MKKCLSRFLAFLILLSTSTLNATDIPVEYMYLYQARMAMAFGNMDTTVDVYVITDWNNLEGQKIDPKIQAFAPEVMKQVRITFLDVFNPEVKNIRDANMTLDSRPTKTPEKYFKIRTTLWELAAKSPQATVDQIKQALLPLDIQYEPLNQKALDIASSASRIIIESFKINKNPLIIVFNTRNSKKRTFENIEQLTLPELLAAIEEVKRDDPLPAAKEAS